MKKKTTKKKNPQDATLRNIRALKKDVKELREEFANLMYLVGSDIDRIRVRLSELENN